MLVSLLVDALGAMVMVFLSAFGALKVLAICALGARPDNRPDICVFTHL